MSGAPWRVAVVGAGIGAEHVAALQTLPRRFAVHTVCDLDAARATALAARCGARQETDLDAVLADPEVDLVDICLPPRLHVPVTLQALRAGKHVVCEKPLAGSLADVDEVTAMARSVGRHVFPVFQYRYGPAMRLLASLQGQGRLGPLRVATLETHWNRGADYYAVPWRGTRDHELGGAVVSHAIHIHDLICALDGPVAELSATLATAVNPIETEDCAALWLRMASGALVTSSITLGAAEDSSRLRLVFEKATVESGRAPYTPAVGLWQITARNLVDAPALQAAADDIALRPGRFHDGFAGFFAEVATALERGEAEAFLDRGRRSVELASAIYLAAATRQAVTLPLGRDSPAYGDWAAVA